MRSPYVVFFHHRRAHIVRRGTRRTDFKAARYWLTRRLVWKAAPIFGGITTRVAAGISLFRKRYLAVDQFIVKVDIAALLPEYTSLGSLVDGLPSGIEREVTLCGRDRSSRPPNLRPDDAGALLRSQPVVTRGRRRRRSPSLKVHGVSVGFLPLERNQKPRLLRECSIPLM